MTADTAGAATVAVQSTASKYTFTGLTPGVTYKLTVNAVSTAGPSNWSSPVSQIAL